MWIRKGELLLRSEQTACSPIAPVASLALAIYDQYHPIQRSSGGLAHLVTSSLGDQKSQLQTERYRVVQSSVGPHDHLRLLVYPRATEDRRYTDPLYPSFGSDHKQDLDHKASVRKYTLDALFRNVYFVLRESRELRTYAITFHLPVPARIT